MTVSEQAVCMNRNCPTNTLSARGKVKAREPFTIDRINPTCPRCGSKNVTFGVRGETLHPYGAGAEGRSS